MYWRDLSSSKLDAIDRRAPVLLPLASTEQHGPHLPVSTDAIINEHFCAEIDKRIGDGVLILPAVSVGCSAHHMDFAGTLTVSHATFERYVMDVLFAAAEQGFVNFMLFNSHGGNQSVGQVVVERFGNARCDLNIVLATWWQIASDRLKEICRSFGSVGHAGQFETSLIQHIAPELVDADKIAPQPKNPTFDWAEADMLHGSKAYLYRSLRDISQAGVDGSPQFASPDQAVLITEAVVDAAVGIIEDLRRPGNSPARQ